MRTVPLAMWRPWAKDNVQNNWFDNPVFEINGKKGTALICYEAYWLKYTDKIKSAIGDVPLILVGGMKYPQTIEKIVQSNQPLDFVGTTPFLVDSCIP